MKNKKPILALDFDGVIHSYMFGWQGARCIPSPPVPGAITFIVNAMEHFEVVIHSSRSWHWLGKRAMKKYLRAAYVEWWDMADLFPDRCYLHHENMKILAREFVAKIRFPLFKPAAAVTIDDRAITFTGIWPSLDSLRRFKPWNK